MANTNTWAFPTLTPASGGQLTDVFGNVWSVQSDGTPVVNGAPTYMTPVTTLALVFGIVYVLVHVNGRGGSNTWSQWNGVRFIAIDSGLPAPTNNFGVANYGPFPPAAPAMPKIIPAYLYEQYADDADVQAFFTAYNNFAQAYLNWFNQINLPIYTGPLIVGPVLDWVAEGLYGLTRPVVSSAVANSIGPFNTYMLNTLPFNTIKRTTTSTTLYTINDDIFKRIITWNFFKGDGPQTYICWIKRRVMRFMLGLNGTNPPFDNHYQVSITMTGPYAMTIRLIQGGMYNFSLAPLLQALIQGGMLPLPIQFTYTVTLA